jgi:hypothetical protein
MLTDYWVADASKATERGRVYYGECRLSGDMTCSFREKNTCICRSIWSDKCLYGDYYYQESGTTKRAKAYDKWLKEAKEKQAEFKASGVKFETAPKSIATIGDYIYIPFSYCDMCEFVPFYRRSGLVTFGIPFIKKEEFTAEIVVTLAKFRPYALMGGEIKDYQKKEVPALLYEVKRTFPELYAKAAELDPSIIVKTLTLDDFSNKLIMLEDASTGKVEVVVKDDRYKGRETIELEWDGENLSGTLSVSQLLSLTNYSSLTNVVFKPQRKVKVKPDQETLTRLFREGKLLVD